MVTSGGARDLNPYCWADELKMSEQFATVSGGVNLAGQPTKRPTGTQERLRNHQGIERHDANLEHMTFSTLQWCAVALFA